MREWFELWDTDAGNMIGAFDTESAALAEVRGLLEENGSEYAADLALARRQADGGTPVADGAILAHLAQTAVSSGDRNRREA